MFLLRYGTRALNVKLNNALEHPCDCFVCKTHLSLECQIFLPLFFLLSCQNIFCKTLVTDNLMDLILSSKLAFTVIANFKNEFCLSTWTKVFAVVWQFFYLMSLIWCCWLDFVLFCFFIWELTFREHTACSVAGVHSLEAANGVSAVCFLKACTFSEWVT